MLRAVFEKFIGADLSQIALENMWLPSTQIWWTRAGLLVKKEKPILWASRDNYINKNIWW